MSETETNNSAETPTTTPETPATNDADKDAGAGKGDANDETDGGAADADAAAGAETDKDKGADAPGDDAGPPETYQFEAPEGLTADPEGMKAFETFARSQNWNQAKASAVLGYMAQGLKDVLAAQETARVNEINQWADDSLKAEDIGNGDEATLAKNLGLAKRAMNAFGSKELGDLTTKNGMCSNPHWIRFCMKVTAAAKLPEDGSLHRGSDGDVRRKTDAEVFFPEMAP